MHLYGLGIAGVAPCLLKCERRHVGKCEEEYAFPVELVCPPTRSDLAGAQERGGSRKSVGSLSDRPHDR
jgi:hypothetical protein